MNRVDDVERIDARCVDVFLRSRRGRQVRWHVIPIVRRRLARHAGRRAPERDRVIAAVGTSESAIASESEDKQHKRTL